MIHLQLFSTFETTEFLEMAISTLEKKGIKKESIFAVPLDNRKEYFFGDIYNSSMQL